MRQATTRAQTAWNVTQSFPRPLVLRLLAALILLVSLVVAAIVVLQQVQTTAALETHTHELLQDVIDETRENARGFLHQAQSAVELTQGLFASHLLSFDQREQLEHYFLEQLRVLPQVDGVFYGDRTGGFFFTKRDASVAGASYVTKVIETDDGTRRVYRIWRDAKMREIAREDDPRDSYDPRQRPWYERASRSDATVWTDPYVFFTSRRPGLTVAVGVRDHTGTLLGTVGADVELNALSEFLARQAIGSQAAAVIVHNQGDVVAFPDPSRLPKSGEGDKLRLAKLVELGPTPAAAGRRLAAEFPQFATLRTAHFDTFEVGGERYRSVFAPFLDAERWPWLMGVYAPEKLFASSIRKAQRQSAVLAAAIGVLGACVVFLLGPLLLGPLKALQRDAFYDPLTQLLNRRGLQAAAAELRKSLEASASLSAIMIDIDRFKAVNDEHGHKIGDEVLVAVARRLRRSLSDVDVLARYGGEEFVVLSPSVPADAVCTVAERLRASVQTSPVLTSAGEIRVTISLGVAELNGSEQELEELLNLADEGLLAAKRRGRDQVVVADSTS